ncbi:hypothetical protein QMZ92_28480 [Streptomyces sp. HNM0645]|uniref:hypothetical protein n=1 Tax=Streptomyces sp. HNM0645 TaxID=2782343 RepID=UPI0024B655B4|nr:hypothetical protein [Streptomyces sp. HNM0645]MDI9888199.1 hypothetical protein [Streptomyces sp. HNM0645]
MDREADLTATVSEIDRPHSQLSRLEGMFPGYRTEIVEGAVVMSPVTPRRAKTIRAVWNALETQLSDEWDVISDAVESRTGRPSRPGHAPVRQDVVVETGVGRLTLDTGGLPVDPVRSLSAPPAPARVRT